MHCGLDHRQPQWLPSTFGIVELSRMENTITVHTSIAACAVARHEPDRGLFASAGPTTLLPLTGHMIYGVLLALIAMPIARRRA